MCDGIILGPHEDGYEGQCAMMDCDERKCKRSKHCSLTKVTSLCEGNSLFLHLPSSSHFKFASTQILSYNFILSPPRY